jgi:hypothetical protein
MTWQCSNAAARVVQDFQVLAVLKKKRLASVLLVFCFFSQLAAVPQPADLGCDQ